MSRLVGDDQQLAAIGAGGAIRDIENNHGALRLSELHRFTDPAEAAATLALRDGRLEALAFYLDRQRVHVGDRTTTLDAVFNAWQSDRNQGLDSIMLAPTRELVRSLNQRARNHRLTGDTPGRQVELADGNPGSVGDLIITRSNDRRLRVTATDWVKNGDRWTILNLDRTGALTVRQIRNGRTIRLPATYVQESVELGYATTVHTAQGVTADTMHGVVTGEESRQQLYTVLTRGRSANHIYVTVVGDGNPHAIVQPDSLHPRTATELLEQILARDASPQSATTLHREQHDPATRLGAAAARYLDALHHAAEHLADPEIVASEQAADSLLSGLAGGPLPWLPGLPDRIAANPNWGPYLDARSHLVAQLADQIHLNANGAPAWAHAPLPAELIADVQVWRAVTHVDPGDLRPTGPRQLDYIARVFQERLDQRLAAPDTNADLRWRQLLATYAPRAIADPFLPELAERLSNLARAGFDATLLVRSAAAVGSLPDDHPAAALWWRILDQLPETPNQKPAAPRTFPPIGRTATTPPERQPYVPRSAPPPAFGPSR